MSLKGSGATSLREIDRWDGGFGWLAYPDEGMERASHAFVSDGDVWLVDPVDAEGLDDLLAEAGEVAGIVVLLDRHNRDANDIAARHGVSVHRPAWMDSIDSNYDVPVRDLGDEVDDTGYRVRKLRDSPVWREAYLHHPEDGTLVVPEALGTASYFLTAGERVGVHPMLRLLPPRELAGYDVERVVMGHGEGVMTDAAAAIRDTVRNSRRRAPGLYVEAMREFLR
ncbi:hypothetical protein [Halomarina litorea]|uniref:hypothetical protein n=1 Tax=Halomarina litorea TaxID=2961595 RepID=UPI0020C3126B|nr:hypothetical protein [Halomarina sp. BCD28]